MATSNFQGVIKICLWFRAHPSSGQESGPPIPNYYLECNGGNEVLGRGFTDKNGCFSLPFESSWPGSSLSVGCSLANGDIGTDISSSDSFQTVDFGDLSVDWLPEDDFQPAFDCSTCTTYNPKDGAPLPLTDHECSQNSWGWDCCGYDWVQNQCKVQQFFPEFQFLHKCNGCQVPGIETEPEPENECQSCEMYYPEASMDTPRNERGKLSPLTGHACSTEDQGCSPVACTDRYGPSCCALDPKTKQCGVFEFETSYTYMNENKGAFSSPCDMCGRDTDTSITDIAIPVVVSTIALFALIVGVIMYKRKRTRTGKRQNDASEKVQHHDKQLLESNNPELGYNFVPNASAPPMEIHEPPIVIATLVADNDVQVAPSVLSKVRV